MVQVRVPKSEISFRLRVRRLTEPVQEYVAVATAYKLDQSPEAAEIAALVARSRAAQEQIAN